MKVEANIKNKSFTAIYDPGSTISLVNENVLKQLKQTFFKDKNLLSTINGSSFSSGRAFLKVKIGKIISYIDLHVIRSDKFKYQILIGLDAIRKFRLLQSENLEIFQRDCKTNTYIKINRPAESIKLSTSQKMNYTERVEFAEHFVNLCTEGEDGEHPLTPDKKKKLEDIINANIECFATDKFDVGKVRANEAHIRLLSNQIAAQRPYRCSIEDRREIDEQVQKLLERGLVSESCSPFAAPVTLAYKKSDGTRSRLCIDFRFLNKLAVPESQPFPLIEDMIERTADCQFFSVIDINSAFWAISVVAGDREKLAFVTHDGHYEFNVLPFGYKNSPAIFMRILSGILKKRGLTGFAMNFMDDILVFSKTFGEHVKHLDQLFRAIREEGFKLKLTKCKFAKRSINYLGHRISPNKVEPIADGLKSIRECPRPTSPREVKHFLGKINYYHRFIEDCSNRMEPLHELLRRDAKFAWTERQENAFQSLKDYLCARPVLQVFDPNKLIYIYTDASGVGVAAVMKQEDEDGILHPVSYFSKKLPETKLRKDAIFIEALAIKEAICFWQHQLMFREFVVVTDHQPLKNLKLKARPDTDLGDLVVFLSQFNFRIVYQEGRQNVSADWLSRYPVYEWFESEEPIRVTNLLELSEIEGDQRSNSNLDQDLLKKFKILFRVKKGQKRVIISETLGQKLLAKAHTKFGHIGANAMLDTLRPYWYFKKMDKAARALTAACQICIKNKSRRKRRSGRLAKLGPPRRPFEVMSLDTVGGFSGNNSTKRYLHILTDHFSKFAWTATSAGQTANDFLKLIRRVTDKHRIGVLLVDQYAGINTKELKDHLKKKEVKLIFTAADKASSNGNVERLGQTLVNRVRCKFNDGNQGKSWAPLAEECTNEYNETRHSVTGFSPKYLLTGVEPEICPVATLARDLEQDRESAFDRLMSDHRENKRRVDKNLTEEPMDVGDKVYVERGSKINRNKLSPIREGPFEISSQKSPLMFELDRKTRKMNIYHKNQLLK